MTRCLVLIRGHEPLQEGWRKRSFRLAGPLLDAFIEERPGRAKGALAPPFLQGLVAADQHEATRHGRLSSFFRIDQRCDERARGSLRPGGECENSTAHWVS